MLIPKPLKKGDRIAVISLSNGLLGESFCAHQKELGVKKLREFGLEPVFTKSALMGMDYMISHPEELALEFGSTLQQLVSVSFLIGRGETSESSFGEVCPFIVPDI